MKFSSFIATSLDGFIAKQDGDINWLDNHYQSEEQREEAFQGFNEFFNRVDCIVMGRGSFEKVLSFGEWPYTSKEVIVLSQSLNSLPKIQNAKLTLYNGPLTKLSEKLSLKGYNLAYVDGGKTIMSFIKAKLLDNITITRIPMLLGCGIPLFGDTQRDVYLKHVDTNIRLNGFIDSKYQFDYSR